MKIREGCQPSMVGVQQINDGGGVNRMINFDIDNGSIIEARLAVRVGTCAFPAQVGSGGKNSYFPLRGVKWQTKKQS
jgi:hypothetical protein